MRDVPTDQAELLSRLPPQVIAYLAEQQGICAEGGGSRGVAYLPIVELLLHLAGSRLHSFCGSSVGAILAMLLATRPAPGRLRAAIESTPWERFARYQFGASWRLLWRGGWYSMDGVVGWIRQQLREAGLPEAVTFEQMADICETELYVTVTRYVRYGSVETSEPFLMSASSTPAARVADAVAASAAVPLLWPPLGVDFGGRLGIWTCADGGVGYNDPFGWHHVAAGLQPGRILGLRVDDAWEVERAAGQLEAQPFRPGLAHVALALVRGLRETANAAHVPSELWRYMLTINTGAAGALAFDPAEVPRLEAAGRAAIIDFANKFIDMSERAR